MLNVIPCTQSFQDSVFLLKKPRNFAAPVLFHWLMTPQRILGTNLFDGKRNEFFEEMLAV